MALDIQYNTTTGQELVFMIFDKDRLAYHDGSGLFLSFTNSAASGGFAYELPELATQSGTYAVSGFAFGYDGSYLAEIHTGATGTVSRTPDTLVGYKEFTYYGGLEANDYTIMQEFDNSNNLLAQLSTLTSSLDASQNNLLKKIINEVYKQGRRR